MRGAQVTAPKMATIKHFEWFESNGEIWFKTPIILSLDQTIGMVCVINLFILPHAARRAMAAAVLSFT